jgi:hypothetical protein
MVIGRITVDRVDVHNRIGHARSTAAEFFTLHTLHYFEQNIIGPKPFKKSA